MARSAKMNFERKSSIGCAITRYQNRFVEKSMKKRGRVFALLIVATLLGAAALVFGFMQQKTQLRTWSIDSPNGAYRVSFSGVRSRPSWPFTAPVDLENRKVRITVTRGGAILVDRAEIYDGDAYDSNFRDLYPNSEWLSETTLHLWRSNHPERDPQRTNEISIRNESDQEVRYLYVKAGKTNLFLLFDMPPGDAVTVRVQLEHWEDLVGCAGKVNKRDFPYRSIDFSLSPAPKSAIRYNVTVGKDGCSVTSKP